MLFVQVANNYRGSKCYTFLYVMTSFITLVEIDGPHTPACVTLYLTAFSTYIIHLNCVLICKPCNGCSDVYLEAVATFTLCIERVWLTSVGFYTWDTVWAKWCVLGAVFFSSDDYIGTTRTQEREGKHLTYMRMMCVKVRLGFRRFIKSGHTRDSIYVTA